MLGKVTSQVRLLQGHDVLEDDRKLSEYSLPEGAIISALFEPDVDITIEVSTGSLTKKLTISNSTSVMVLKTQINGVMRSGVAAEKLEIRLGDMTLEDTIPLHYYGIKDGSKLDIVKPFVSVTIKNDRGATLYLRIGRKDTIKEVKTELVAVQSLSPMEFYFYGPVIGQPSVSGRSNASRAHKIKGSSHAGCTIPNSMRLYLVTEEGDFDELDDEKTVEDYKIKDDDNLFLLTSSWTFDKCDVTVVKTGRKIQGVDPEDTCLGIKVRVQEQLGIPVKDLKVVADSRIIHDEGKPMLWGTSVVVGTDEDF